MSDDAPDTLPADHAHDGAARYRRVLGGAGGREIELLARDAGAPDVCVGMYASPPYDLAVPALAVSRLSVNLTPAVVSGGLEDDRPQRHVAARHSLFLTPAGAAAHWRKEAPSRHLNIYFRTSMFDGPEDASLAGPARTPLLNGHAPGVRTIADALVEELLQPGVAAEEAADSLGRLLLVRVLRHGLAVARAQRAPRRAIGPAGLQRLREWVMDHLAQRILVRDLAAVVRMPPERFAEASARETGQTPHRWVLALRLAHAESLLRQSPAGLADIAASCGFANQQHLTRVMRRRLGTTPGRYRDAARRGPVVVALATSLQLAASPAEPAGMPPAEPSSDKPPEGSIA